MRRVWSRLKRELLPKVYGLAFGLTLGVGAAVLNQGCLTTGQCATCGGACASRLPILALPLLLGGAAALLRKGPGKWIGRRKPVPGCAEGSVQGSGQ